MHPRDPLLRRRQVVAERRPRPLALPQHLLVDQRQLRQPLQPPRRLASVPDPPMQRRARRDILALPRPLRLAMSGEVFQTGRIGSVDEQDSHLASGLILRAPISTSCLYAAEGRTYRRASASFIG